MELSKTINPLAYQNRSIVEDVRYKRLMKEMSSLIVSFVWHRNQRIINDRQLFVEQFY